MLHDRNNRNTTTTTTTTTTTNTNTPCPYFARGYCRNGNNCPQRHVRGHLGRGDEMDIDNMTYDQILALEERMGNVPTKLTKPLTKSQISRLPTRKFQGNSDSLKDHTSCCVCLCDYEKGDDLITLPCLHTFHKDCITQWLGKQKPTCPVCKAFVDTENDFGEATKSTPCLDFARGSCRRSNCPYLHGKCGGRSSASMMTGGMSVARCYCFGAISSLSQRKKNSMVMMMSLYCLLSRQRIMEGTPHH